MDEGHVNSDLRSVPTLKDLSVIAAASYLCQHLNIKDKIAEFLDKHHPVWRTKKPYDQYRELIQGKYLTQLLQEISLIFWKELNEWKVPRILKLEIHDKALEITERFHNWMLHIICDLDLSSKYIEKIYVTANGEIDEDKIFKSHWINFPLDKPTKESFLDGRITMLHYLACAFFQEEFIITNQAKILEEIKSIEYFLVQKDNNDAVFSIMKHVTRYLLGMRNPLAITHLATNPLPELVEISTLSGFYKPFIYFWNRCNESQKSIFLDFFFSHLWIFRSFYWEKYYIADNLFKIITFLINKVNESRKILWIEKFTKFFIFNYPESKCWQKVGTRIFDRYLPIISESEVEAQFLKQIFNIFDVSLLKTVMDHDIYKCRKNYVINFGQEKCKILILNNDFKSLDWFLDNVFKTEDGKNYFKKEFNFLQEFISNNQWEKVEKVLNWMRTLSKNHKRDIIFQELKRFVSKRRREISVPILLKWYSNTDKKPLINNCEDQSSLKDLTREIICRLWFRYNSICNKHPIFAMSSGILNLVFGKKKLIRNFKKTEVAKDGISIVKLFCEVKLEMKLTREPAFSVIDEFLKFCEADEKIDQVKTSIANDIRDWILQYGVCLQRFDIIVPLFDWVYGSETNNRELLKIYFENSEEVENYYQNRIS